MVLTTAELDLMASHGWGVRPNFVPVFFIVVREKHHSPNDPLAPVVTTYHIELYEQSSLPPGKRWVLGVRATTGGHVRGTETLDYYPDPVTCSVELKLLGDGSIRKGVEEIVRDRIAKEPAHES